MTERPEIETVPPGGALKVLVGSAAFVVLVAGMRSAGELLVPLLLAIFIAIVAAPPLFYMRRRGLPTALALMVVVAAVVVATLGLAGLIGSSLQDFSGDLPRYQGILQEQLRRFANWLAGHGVAVGATTLTGLLDPGAAMQLAGGMLRGLGSALTNTFLILLTVIFILAEAAGLPAKLRALFGEPENSLAHFDEVIDKIQRYVAIKSAVSLATGLLIAGWLWYLGVDYAFMWGLLALLLNFVPNIGSIIAAVPAVLLAWLQLGPATALLAAGGFVAVNVVMGNLVEPRYMGRGLGLSTLVVFLSLVFWGWVLGPVGMLLSVPLTMTAKIALDNTPGGRWLGILLGPTPANPPAPAAPPAADSPPDPDQGATTGEDS